MFKLFNYFVDLVLFRHKPQDIPASSSLMVLVLIAYFVVSVIHGQQLFGSLLSSFLAALADLVFLLFALSAVLYVTDKGERFLQTITALAGGATIITLIAIPVQLLMGNGEQMALANQIGVLIYLVIIIWNFIFIAYVIRHALDITMIFGMLVAFTYLVFSSAVVTQVLPEAG